jgi:hypothetical protein
VARTTELLAELVAALPDGPRGKVQGIPFRVEPEPAEINAYAGCERGRPFMAVTDGLLLAVDALARTRAHDEVFGTRTADRYASEVVPTLLRDPRATPALPANMLPPATAFDPRVSSLARQRAEEALGFTLAHEVAHHHLGHTGCANGESAFGQNAAQLGHLATSILPGLNQPNELAADNAGVWNLLDAGRRRPSGPRLTEQGGLMLLGFFGQLSAASGARPLHPAAILKSHPNPQLRIPIVQNVAALWAQSQPR